jgi:hypothetical protein
VFQLVLLHECADLLLLSLFILLLTLLLGLFSLLLTLLVVVLL